MSSLQVKGPGSRGGEMGWCRRIRGLLQKQNRYIKKWPSGHMVGTRRPAILRFLIKGDIFWVMPSQSPALSPALARATPPLTCSGSSMIRIVEGICKDSSEGGPFGIGPALESTNVEHLYRVIMLRKTQNTAYALSVPRDSHASKALWRCGMVTEPPTTSPTPRASASSSSLTPSSWHRLR